MSRMTTLQEETNLIDFAMRAAKLFAEKPECSTFSACGIIEPGCLLALRWGMGNDCVLVVKLDESNQPVNFQQAVKHVK